MSDFQVALFALGALVILVVLGVNLWHGRHGQTSADADMTGHETGQVSHKLPIPPDFVGSGWHSRIDAGGVDDPDAPSRPAMDAVIDAICPIELDQPLGGEEILKALPTRKAIGGKIVLVEGKESQSGAWEVPQRERTYGELNISVQLANRKGPLTQVECGEFNALAFYFAQALDANARFPDSVELLEQARSLDSFAERCDQVLSLTLKTRADPWTFEQLHEAAMVEGLTEQEGDGKMLRYGLREEGIILATLVAVQSHQIGSATVMLYVPAVPADKRPFERMLELCRKLQFNLGAEIVDDNGQPLLESQLKTISERLGHIYEIMSLQGIPAGSESAMRLFSD